MAVEIKCDKCRRRFGPNLRGRFTPGKGALQEMECPHCYTVYPVALITPKGLVIRDRLNITSDPAERRELETQLKEEVTRP